MKVSLLDIAHARSGDKGDTANVGLIALKPEWYAVLEKYVTRDRVAAHFAGMITGGVVRFELPNLGALNFLLHGALDGGGTLSLKTDAQGKVYSTALLRMVIDVPDAEARSAGPPGVSPVAVSKITIAKLVLGIGGIALFLRANAPEQQRLRWVAVACVAAAWLFRFLERGERRPRDRDPNQGPSI